MDVATLRREWETQQLNKKGSRPPDDQHESNSSMCSASSGGNTSTRDIEIDVVGEDDDDDSHLNVDSDTETDRHRRLTEEERAKLGFNIKLEESNRVKSIDDESDKDKVSNSMNLTLSFFNNRSLKPRRLNPFSIESLLSRAETLGTDPKDAVADASES